MKLGISMWSYYAPWKRGELDIPEFIRGAKRLDFDGVELLDFFWKDRAAETPHVLEALAETGLAVGVYSISNDFVTPDASLRQEQVQVIRRGVDSANEFGAKVVRVFAGNYVEEYSFGDAFDWIVDGLRQSAEYAEANGVVLALENHGRLAGRSDQVISIVDAVGSPAMRANPDTGNFLLVHQAPHEAVKDVAGLAGMVHFKDFHLVDDDYAGFAYTALDGLKFVGTAIGEGDVALQKCVDELKEAGFDGWVNIEYEGEESAFTAIPRSVENAKKLLA